MSPPFSTINSEKPVVVGIEACSVIKSVFLWEYKLISAVTKSSNNPIFHPKFHADCFSQRKSVKRTLFGRIPMELIYPPSTPYTLK